jgi:hypothetical protein
MDSSSSQYHTRKNKLKHVLLYPQGMMFHIHHIPPLHEITDKAKSKAIPARAY